MKKSTSRVTIVILTCFLSLNIIQSFTGVGQTLNVASHPFLVVLEGRLTQISIFLKEVSFQFLSVERVSEENGQLKGNHADYPTAGSPNPYGPSVLHSLRSMPTAVQHVAPAA